MADGRAGSGELRALESLASSDSAVHRLHPLCKIIFTLCFIIVVTSFGRHDIGALAPLMFYPFIMCPLAGIPQRLLLSRFAVALPFCLFAAFAGLFTDRSAAFTLGEVKVTFGMIAAGVILLKSYLCVTAALILATTTPIGELAGQLRRMHVPGAFVMTLELTYRYIGVLLEEVHSSVLAYRLRSGDRKALDIRHMGSFLGQILLRGFDRAQRIHSAMCLRGYSAAGIPAAKRRFTARDFRACLIVCVPVLAVRFFYLWKMASL